MAPVNGTSRSIDPGGAEPGESGIWALTMQQRELWP